MMKKILFLLSLMLVFVVSCGDGGKSAASPENGENSWNSSENSGENGDFEDSENSGKDNYSDEESTNNDSETPESEEENEKQDSGNSEEEPDSDSGENSETNPVEEPVEEPDEDKPSENTAKYCIFGCNTASDCVPAGANAITDADNYDCKNGTCEYKGCLSDAECDEIYSAVTAATGRVYRCNKNGAYGYPECTPKCSTAADCDLYGQGTSTEYAYDFDNYKCESGFCVFTGCNSDAECEATIPSSDYKCQPQEYSGKTLKICTLSCKSAADCANSAYPADFYECRNSQCVTKNCESDEWCQTYMTDDYVCK